MDGNQAVLDGNGSKLTDEQLGKLSRRSDELKRRISEGTLPYDWVMDELQRVIEGCGYPKILWIDPQPFDLAKLFLSRMVIDEQDERSLSIAELDLSKIQFETCLRKDESYITGNEKLRRLKAMSIIRHGGNEFLALWQDYKANEESSRLEWLRKSRGITYLDFFGLILRRPDDGHRFVLCLRWVDRKWRWECCWLNLDWRSLNLSAVSAK